MVLVLAPRSYLERTGPTAYTRIAGVSSPMEKFESGPALYSVLRDRFVSGRPATALNPAPSAIRTAAPARPSSSAIVRSIPANSWRARPPTQKDIPPIPMSTQDKPLTIGLITLFSNKTMLSRMIPVVPSGSSPMETFRGRPHRPDRRFPIGCDTARVSIVHRDDPLRMTMLRISMRIERR